MTDHKEAQRRVYNEKLLNTKESGLGLDGFRKIKTLKDLVNYKSIKKLGLNQNEKVLDIGCNAGELLNKVVKKYKVRGYGVDISDKTIEYAKNHNPFNNNYKVGDAENLDYKNDSFDAVISTDVLEHVARPKKVLEEVERVLKPGGKFYIYCISKRNFFTLGWFLQLFHYKNAWGDLGDHSKEYLVDPEIFYSAASLKVERIEYFDSFFMHLVDEFIIRPILYLVSKRKRSPKASVASSTTENGWSAQMYIYYVILVFVYYVCLILDTPWRIFGLSNAVLVSGRK